MMDIGHAKEYQSLDKFQMVSKSSRKLTQIMFLLIGRLQTDKASMLDEVIEYLKQLQAQIHMMSRVSPLMLPSAMQQQLHMSMMNPMGLGMEMGMGMGPVPGMPHVLHPSAFIPLANSWEVAAVSAGDRVPAPMALMPDPMSAFLACQSQVRLCLASHVRFGSFSP